MAFEFDHNPWNFMIPFLFTSFLITTVIVFNTSKTYEEILNENPYCLTGKSVSLQELPNLAKRILEQEQMIPFIDKILQFDSQSKTTFLVETKYDWQFLFLQDGSPRGKFSKVKIVAKELPIEAQEFLINSIPTLNIVEIQKRVNWDGHTVYTVKTNKHLEMWFDASGRFFCHQLIAERKS